MKDVDLRTEALIAAKKLGLETSKVVFSNKLEWVDVDGEVVLRQAVVNGVAGKVTLYLDAMKARWYDNDLYRRMNDVLQDCIATLKGDQSDELTFDEKEFDESEHPRDEDGKFTFSGGGDDSGGGYEFVSPNVGDLDFQSAVSGLNSARQKALTDASVDIDKQLNLDSNTSNAVGAWRDGAEHTIADFHGNTKWTDWPKVALSASMKGWLGNQKSVLAFQELPDRKPRESVALQGQYPQSLGTLPEMTVEINPTERELRSLAEDYEKVRVTADANGNLYAWDANKAIHDQVVGAMHLDEHVLTYRDVWILHEGKLVSARFWDESPTQNPKERLKEARNEVRDKLASLEGNSVLLSFQAKGSLEDIHKNLLSDGLAFHTVVPNTGGALVYVAETDPKKAKELVDLTNKAAERYGSKITYRHGRGEFIGDNSGEPTRDNARSIYESNIRKSPVHRSQAIWEGIRDRWRATLDETDTSKKVKLFRRALVQPLYVRRDLLNADEVATWAKDNGFKTTVDDMHVTIVFSKTPVDWDVVDSDEYDLLITTGSRSLAPLGNEGAVVLKFSSADLQKRWKQFIDAGASWDWPNYQPHVTLTYDGADVDLDITPYTGELLFGPEIFQQLDLSWKDKVTEKEFDESEHPRDEDGKFTFSGGGSDGGNDVSDTGLSSVDEHSDFDSVANVNQRAADSVREGSKTAKGPALKNSEGHPGLISTASITAVKKPHGDSNIEYMRADVTQMRKDPELFKSNVGLFADTKNYPLRKDETKGGTEKLYKTVQDRMIANLRWLYDTTPKTIRDRAALWYPGSRLLVDKKVKEYSSYGLTDVSAAAVYAAMSPQKDWDQNVYLGDRMIDIYLTKQNAAWDQKMTDEMKSMIKTAKATAAAAADKGVTQRGAVSAALKKIEGKKLSEIVDNDPEIQAKLRGMWVWLYDNSHSDRSFHTITPEGTYGGWVLNNDGTKAKAAWSGLNQIAPAIQALEAKGDRAKISAILSDRHKVRSFYNNILDPFSVNGDVTADTHAVGAAWLMPYSGSSVAVAHSLKTTPKSSAKPGDFEGAKGSAKVGIYGTYPIYTEAVRKLAEELKITPRAVQSITWVAKRERFSNRAQNAKIAAVWHDYQTGKETLKGAQTRIDKIAPFKSPGWTL